MTLSSQVADFFAILGDRTRIRILGLVYEMPLTVNEIREKLGDISTLSYQALSYQLKKLEDHHLIKFEDNPKDGRSKYVHLMDAHISHILNDAIVHIQGGAECEGTLDCEDNENLKLLMVTP